MAAVSPVRLAGVFAELSDALVGEFDLVKFLHKVTIRTSELVEVSAARLLADNRSQLQVVVASDERAHLAYSAYEQVFQVGPRRHYLAAAGAVPQRPLWASTGVKDPALADTLYVGELVAPNTVNTMPEKTLAPFADHGEVTGDTVSDTAAAAQEVLDAISAAGVDITDVFRTIEDEGVEKFIASWAELADTVQEQLNAVTRR